MTERPARPPAPFRFADDAPPSEVRRHRKQRLAAAFRLFGRFGFDEGVAGHITARDPELTDHFWVNPFGLSFRQIRVSDLILVDHDGRVVEGDWPVNRAAFAIHSQLHQARPDIVAAAHSHSRFGRALSALDTRIEPITQDSCAFFEDHARFDDYTGVVDETDEGTYVLFLTSRGLKHAFTGFLRVPPDGDPRKFFEFEDKPPSQLVRYDKDWYFVAN